MAGNIPPLVSSTPPPLNAFDDEEDEEEDEFGLYNTSEDIEFNDCISFREKDEEKQNVLKSRGEQDSASQDSATDSGLCQDSEGVSPTPPSDEERTLKQNLSLKLCQNTKEPPLVGVSELSVCKENTINHETVSGPNFPNGNAEEDHSEQGSDDDFGNFEFAPSQKTQKKIDREYQGSILKDQSLPKHQDNDVERNTGNVLNTLGDGEKSLEKEVNAEENLSQLYLSESKSDGLILDNIVSTVGLEETARCENIELKVTESMDLFSNNSLIDSIDSNMGQQNTSSQCQKNEQHGINNIEKIPKRDYEDGFMINIEHFDHREQKEIPEKNSDDDEFDEFTDFKAEFPSLEQSEQLNEHSKTFVEPLKLEDASLSLPPSHQEESDDEFSNFADFSSSDCAFVSAQSSNSLENISHIPLKLDDSDLRTESEFQDWVSVFPSEDIETSPVMTALLRQDDVVWSRLFPLESSPALSYQWNESLANRRLLTALNIDSRNILFTPWSSAVPRFAANLSCGPLEPTKAAEPIQPTSAPLTTTSVTPATANANPTPAQESVPDAHFDWVGSGLTNPLDSCHSSLLDLNFIMTIETQLAICPKTVLNLPKILSAEAENILSLLPDISFMRKTYIDFPIGDA